MEVMEDGNLMDKVLILIQRDMEYYNSKQTVLQETICPGIVGGRLDFPRSASFAAVKLVLWWEEEFLAAYRKGSGFLQEENEDSEKSMVTSGGCGGIVKTSDPAKFISLITKSSDQLLEHLHILTQEALDHADLTVLTGTIGAAALLKNCLWCYIQTDNSKYSTGEQLQTSQKKYQEMVEALAERLLDLHCRLLSLYILQDADSLDWENPKPFCESERGSYVIQMWWLYMQGTKEDLWNSVPPKMAQRVFSGMLNESLTILTVRYSHALPSHNRTLLYSVDISNLLLCITNLLPPICNSADEFIGINLNSHSKILRDIHSKSQELFTCLLLRSSPLDILYKVFKKGLDKIEIFKPKSNGPIPWTIFTMSHLFPDYYTPGGNSHDLSSDTAITLELLVLLPQPQPNWSLLLKVLCMEKCRVSTLILTMAMDELKRHSNAQSSVLSMKAKCGGFLCSGDGTCKGVNTSTQFLSEQHYYDLIYSVTYLILIVGNEKDYQKILLKYIVKEVDWFQCFDRRQVWNQKRPAWFEAILDLIKEFLAPATQAVIDAVKTGASMYQACSIIFASFVQLWECVNPSVTIIAMQIQEMLPASIIPIGKSTLLQIIISALYSELLNRGYSHKVKLLEKGENKEEGEPSTEDSDESVALAIAEALCSIDEDNKHTEEIEELLEQARVCKENLEVETDGCNNIGKSLEMLEILVSDLLLTDQGKKSLKVLQHFIKNNCDWLLQKISGTNEEKNIIPNIVNKMPEGLLHRMFYIGDDPFDMLWECVNPSVTIIAMQIQEMLPASIIPIGKSTLLQIIISALYSELLNRGYSHKVKLLEKGENKEEGEPSTEDSDESVALAIAEALCSIDEDNKHTEEIEELLEQARVCKENLEVETDGCNNIGKSLEMLEILVSDLLLTDQGKKSLKVLQHFIKNNCDWLLQKISGTNEEKNIIPNIVNKMPEGLLHRMFYIGDDPFDMFLVGDWNPNWLGMFNIAMGFNLERASIQISSRWEFRDSNFVNTPDGHIVSYINGILKQINN